MMKCAESGQPLVCIRPPGWVKAGTDQIIDLITWVERAEELGFDGAFVGDRFLSEATTPEGSVYGASMLDVVVAMTTMAARTERISLGSLVMVFPFRHPLQLAKTIASMDAVSQGRIILGAGLGWNPKEFEALGLPMAGRGEQFEEYLALVKKLWSGGMVDHHGAHWQFEGVQIVPPPARQGGPPIWLASFSPAQKLNWVPGSLPAASQRQLNRVGRLADGWIPLVYSASAKRRIRPDTLGHAWELVLESAQAAGRARSDIDFVLSDWGYILDGPGSIERCQQALSRFFSGSWEDALATYSIGTAGQVVEKLCEQTADVDRVDAYIFTPLSEEPEQMELWAGVADALRSGTS